MADELISAVEVAKLIGGSVATVYRLSKSGQLPAAFNASSRLTRWRRADVLAYLGQPVETKADPEQEIIERIRQRIIGGITEAINKALSGGQ